MDLAHYSRVLWRFRLVVLAGMLLGGLLAVLSVARIGFDGVSPKLTYRQSEEWVSSASVFVTQEGFPLGRAIYDEFVPLERGDEVVPTPLYSDPSRFGGHAALFARLAMSDQVRQRILRAGPIEGQYSAAAAGADRLILPLVEISAVAPSEDKAIALARRVSTAFLDYVDDQQKASEIRPERRVALKLVNSPREAVLVTERKFNRAIFVFIAVMSLAVALAFVLENMRPAMRMPQGQELDVVAPIESTRKTA